MSAPAFEFVDAVTSDLTFVARGATPGEAFAAAAQALLAATIEDPASVEEREVRRIELAEPDVELLLLRFVNELVYLRDAELLLLRPRAVHLSLDSGARLEAELAGERIDRSRHRLAADVKAATAHGLSVAKTPRGWEARVTLDV
ncbi:MAG TPA: archease [Myxococcota bacterium]|nr:archease [Myxococcota bacterium]